MKDRIIPAASASHLSVLVVDDDVLVREVTAWMLADAGHTVHEAADGIAALEFLMREGPVDLVIADINMPGMDGLALTDEVKARWPELPVLLVSGRPQPPGTQEYISKPFAWGTLKQAVSRLTHPSPALGHSGL